MIQNNRKLWFKKTAIEKIIISKFKNAYVFTSFIANETPKHPVAKNIKEQYKFQGYDAFHKAMLNKDSLEGHVFTDIFLKLKFLKLGFLICSIMSFSLSGCQSLSLFSSPIQKRGVSGFFKDNLLRAKITKSIFKQYKGSVSCLIHKGHVMLVGYVQSEEDHQKILNALKNFKEIKRLSDHLMIGKESQETLNDTYLSQTLQSRLFFDTRIQSQNYHITASHKILYILGTAGSESEKQSVLHHAESMKVRHVISDIAIEKIEETSTDISGNI